MLLQSLIQPVNKVFLREDFDAVSGLRYIPPSRTIDNNDPWNSLVEISPQQFHNVLTQGLPGEPMVRIASNHDGDFVISMTEKNEIYFDSRAIDLLRKKIQAGEMGVDLKGQEIGQKILRNYIELGVHLKMNSFSINAGRGNGGYAWARAGVPLEENHLSGDVEQIRATLSDRLQAVQKYLPEDVFLKALNLIQLEDVHDINAVADLDFILLKSTTLEFEEKRVREIAEFCEDNNKGFTLGRYLLNGASYNGCIDFFDPKTMCRIENYVGGFKTIALMDVDPEFDALRGGISQEKSAASAQRLEA